MNNLGLGVSQCGRSPGRPWESLPSPPEKKKNNLSAFQGHDSQILFLTPILWGGWAYAFFPVRSSHTLGFGGLRVRTPRAAVQKKLCTLCGAVPINIFPCRVISHPRKAIGANHGRADPTGHHTQAHSPPTPGFESGTSMPAGWCSSVELSQLPTGRGSLLIVVRTQFG